MPIHVVRPGQHLAEIAYRQGVEPGDVWQSDDNAALRDLREGGHMLAPGDVVHLPDRVHPDPADLSVGSDNTFKVQIPKVRVSIVLHHGADLLASEGWRLEGNGERAEGQTGDDGRIDVDVRVTTSRARIVLTARGQRLDIGVGQLDPIGTVTGIAQRLRNLGLYRGPIDGCLSPALGDALEAFQRERGTRISREMDTETLTALRDAHGS